MIAQSVAETVSRHCAADGGRDRPDVPQRVSATDPLRQIQNPRRFWRRIDVEAWEHECAEQNGAIPPGISHLG